MLKRLQARRGDEGFTLIELLVVIIIIGILAAIAIPVFLNQRKKGWEAAVKADLRNAATAQETKLTEDGTYFTSGGTEDPVTNGVVLPAWSNLGFKASSGQNYDGGTATSANITVEWANAGLNYCLQATANGGAVFNYSSPGGLATGDCPAQPTP